MADDKRDKAEEEQDDLTHRFPRMPRAPEIPDAPKLEVKLPPHPDLPQPGDVKPGQYNKAALALASASAFVTPVIVLALVGYMADQALKHTTAWFAFGGVVLGLVVGLMALMRIMNRLDQ